MLITPLGIVILLLFVGIPAGIFLFSRWRKGGLSFRVSKETKGKQADNTMIIDDKRGIYFDAADHADMIPMTCRNNGQEYYVLKRANNVELPLDVPDSCIYYDPGEYGNVLTMKAHADLFERRRTMLQNIAPWALVVGMIVVGVFLIMATG